MTEELKNFDALNLGENESVANTSAYQKTNFGRFTQLSAHTDAMKEEAAKRDKDFISPMDIFTPKFFLEVNNIIDSELSRCFEFIHNQDPSKKLEITSDKKNDISIWNIKVDETSLVVQAYLCDKDPIFKTIVDGNVIQGCQIEVLDWIFLKIRNALQA